MSMRSRKILTLSSGALRAAGAPPLHRGVFDPSAGLRHRSRAEDTAADQAKRLASLDPTVASATDIRPVHGLAGPPPSGALRAAGAPPLHRGVFDPSAGLRRRSSAEDTAADQARRLASLDPTV